MVRDDRPVVEEGAWRLAWRQPVFRAWILVLSGSAGFIAWGLPRFFAALEARSGGLPFDPVIPHFAPADLSWLTFAILYGTLAPGLWRLLARPWWLVRALAGYLCLTAFRVVTLWSFTLEPPATIIPLEDPLTQFFYPGATPFLKDLFFSGHTATLALLACALPTGPLRIWTMAATVAIGSLVIAQHVHWTVDVLAAPFFALAAWWCSGRLPGMGAAMRSAFA
jgi:hypothetical protein